ncbi:E3 ubiquitin-protein ligase RNF169-like [Aricia agestis]|uniref:E3 ubiquitin-protein ligase RNF169-like n=1 Tax=Aricia agestis TaxID=91739 RepID=UPI001C206624|nr:E3 ubiquitin-protein ligase RNF169-like [Aricia agestis]
MAAKSKKRLSKIENKLTKLDNLELKDIICSICQSILIEPVTLPCYHDFCFRCFHGSIQNNALCCPLCRLRIGSWLRTATKQNNLVNKQLWNFIKTKFSNDIDKKVRGEELDLPNETPLPRISEPGEIRLEYEAELKRLREERLRLEEKQILETQQLIRKLHQEEEEAHKRYLERLKQDELLAKQIQKENDIDPMESSSDPKRLKDSKKCKLKPMKIDSYLTKLGASCSVSISQSADEESAKTTTEIKDNNVSPEMVPNYSKLLKNYVGKSIRTEMNVWNKENGNKKGEQVTDKKEKSNELSTSRNKNGLLSLLVSLPLPQTRIAEAHKIKKKNIETDSVDSMQQELCYFKPIEGSTPISFASNKDLPLRIPSVRPEPDESISPKVITPTRDQYLEELYNLRKLSLELKLPSAFVIAPNILKPKEQNIKLSPKSKSKKGGVIPNLKDNKSQYSLRRTRSMGSITKDNEVTPKKKGKERKACSDRKPYLRSDTRKPNKACSPLVVEEFMNNNKIKSAVKNLSSPLENCDVKCIVQEQLRIEMMIEQEQKDLELAKKMDAEWNGRRQPRRAANKRQMTINYALRPAKKLKV